MFISNAFAACSKHFAIEDFRDGSMEVAIAFNNLLTKFQVPSHGTSLDTAPKALQLRHGDSRKEVNPWMIRVLSEPLGIPF